MDEEGFITHENDHEEWSRLKQIWMKERKPGVVVFGGEQYMVVQTGDQPKFKPQRGIDQLYGETHSI